MKLKWKKCVFKPVFIYYYYYCKFEITAYYKEGIICHEVVSYFCIEPHWLSLIT